LPYLRIPGAFNYLDALDRRLNEFLAGYSGEPEEALELASADFRTITDRLGIERQLEFYRSSLL
jgi:multiple sugar transport system substrate-binding protein